METKVKNSDLMYLENATLDLLKKSTAEGGYMSASKIVNAISLMKNGQKVRKIINNLRQQGEPIISSKSGYRYTEDITDVFLYSESLKMRIEEMVKAYKGIVKYVKKNTPEINDWK